MTKLALILGQSTAPFCIVLYKLVQQGRMDRWHYAVQLRTYILTNRNNCVLYTCFNVQKRLCYWRLLQQNSLCINQLEAVRYVTDKAVEVPPHSIYYQGHSDKDHCLSEGIML